APPERLVLVVEEGVFLEPAPEHRGGARRLDRGARRLDRLEPQLDLALERRRGAHKRGIIVRSAAMLHATATCGPKPTSPSHPPRTRESRGNPGAASRRALGGEAPAPRSTI